MSLSVSVQTIEMETTLAPALWSPGFTIDDPVLNFEHQMIFALIENCVRVSRSGGNKDQLIEILNITKAYLMYHFTGEEKMMGDANDGRYEIHRAQHRQLLATLTREIDRFKNDDPALTAQGIVFTLFDWYSNHLTREDMQLLH